MSRWNPDKVCSRCGMPTYAPYNRTSKCRNCGGLLSTACTNCGHLNAAGHKECEVCGLAIDDDDV